MKTSEGLYPKDFIRRALSEGFLIKKSKCFLCFSIIIKINSKEMETEKLKEEKLKKPKNARFYAEVVLTTVLSLVSASLFVDLFKRMLAHHFDNSWEATLMIAAVIACVAVFSLKYMFSEN
jgi:uncharacterized membrane protein